MKSIYGIEYKLGLLLDLHLPDDGEFDLFVYFHGGYLRAGSRGCADAFAPDLCDRKIAVASVDYRLYPSAKFPDFIVDCADSVRWLSDNIEKYGKCRRIIVGGSSAGAYISMMLCFDHTYYKNAGVEPSAISAYIHDAGQTTSHSSVLCERGYDRRRVIVDDTAPLYFVGVQKEYPPMMFVVSDNDLCGRYEENILMLNALCRYTDKERMRFVLREGKHCEYVEKKDEEGHSAFAGIILPFIESLV